MRTTEETSPVDSIWFRGLNEPLDLGTHQFVVQPTDRVRLGSLRFEFDPSPRLVAALDGEETIEETMGWFADGRSSVWVDIPTLGISARGSRTDDEKIALGPVEWGSQMSEVRMALANGSGWFDCEIGPRTAEFSGGGWTVTVSPRDDLSEIDEEATGTACGYAVSHEVTARRVDGQPFGPSEANEIVSAMTSLATFANGSAVGSPAVQGYLAGELSYERYWTPRVPPWHHPLSWLPAYDPKLPLQDIGAKFLELWSQTEWREVLRRLVLFHSEANAANHHPPLLDIRIVIAQSGLELLAWAVLDHGCPPPVTNPSATLRGPVASKAGPRIRELAALLGIDPETPSDCPQIARFLADETRQLPERTAASVLAWARNRATHPKRPADLVAPDGLLIEVWLLSVWYLELSILSVLGYDGNYAHRLSLPMFKGARQQVPWSTTTT
jgi:hypothetical protein